MQPPDIPADVIAPDPKPTHGGTREGAGRPPKSYAETHERFLLGLSTGIPLRQAAAIAGVSHTSVYRWIAADEAGDVDYAGIAERIEIARDEGRAKLIGRIITAGKDPRHWTACAWLLERSDPEGFGKIDPALRDKLRAETASINRASTNDGRAGELLVIGLAPPDDTKP